MCDERTGADAERYLSSAMSRRAFGAAAAGAVGAAVLLPRPANALEVRGRDVSIATADGTCDAYLVAPAGGGRYPGVIVWPDIMGLRPAFRAMGDRLAQSGYAVLTVNQFYRSTRAPYLAAGESYDQPEVRARITPWRAKLTPAATVADATAFVAFLDGQAEVDRARGIGTTGYCMGGPMTVRTAAAHPDRVRAGASFHGTALVTDAPDSPHRLISAMRAAYLVAIAENDDQNAPGDKDALRAAFADAKLPAEIEVYAGAMHGWCPPDGRAHNPAQAERAWERLLALLAKAL